MHSAWLLFGFGFSNLAMLGWLAAAAAPLLIHLWSRRRYREVPWAAVTFLIAAMRKHSRRIQLEQWLLLAVRTLIILLVVLAVAEPYGEQPGTTGGPTHRVLVLDTSFSMATRDATPNRLARAKQLASALVERSGPADAFTVITLADPPRQLVGREIADRRIVAAEIDSLAATHGTADLPATLELVATALELGPSETGRIERQEVDFFTDLQRATWELKESSLDGLARLAALQLFDMGESQTANTAITDLRPAEPLVTVGRPVAFDAVLREFGGVPRSGAVVELLIDGEPVGQQTVDIPAGGEVTVRFSHRFREPGSYAVAVRTSGDRLDVDDTRWLAVPVPERIEVLCVGSTAEDAMYIASALHPDPTDDAAIHVRIATEGELTEIELAPFDCVFLSNVGRLTPSDSQRLARYVRGGGGLAVFLGDRVDADSYNAAADGDEPLLPARLGAVLTEARFGLDPLEYRHPIVAPFRGRERAGLLSTPIHRYVHLLPLPPGEGRGEGALIALTTPTGDPLIITAPQGRGRVVLVATAGSIASVDVATGQPWTTWPAWPSFLPIVREMLNYAVGGRQDAWQVTVGQPLAIPEPPEATGDTLQITRPDGRTATVHARRYADTDLAGIYTVQSSDGDGAMRFAVNVDARESDLAQVNPQKLPPQLSTERGGNADNRNAAVQRVPWSRSLLWSALALVLLELCLAWRFGRGAA